MNSVGNSAFFACTKLTIYAESTSKPTNWHTSWNNSNRPVVWGATMSSDKSYVVSFNKTATSISNPSATNGISAPYREDYNFGGWYNNSSFTGTAISATNIALSSVSNGTYYAKWTIVSVTITFNLNSGTGNFPAKTINYNSKISKPATNPTPPIGNSFNFWALSTDLTKEYAWNTLITENIELIAVFQTTSSAVPGVIFTLINGGYQISASSTNISGEVVIPSKLNGFPVKSIAPQGFANCIGITSMTLPSTLTSIGDAAFVFCTGLTSITVPSSVTSFGAMSFFGCTKLTIYTEAASQPSTWDPAWNISNRPVVWGYTLPTA